jgi:Glycosyltransferase family 87
VLGTAGLAMAVATACFAAAAARFNSLVSTLLTAYVAYVANLGLVTLVLSPTHSVTREGIAIAEAVLLVIAIGCWWLRGRPGPAFGPAHAAVRNALSDPVTIAFLAGAVVLLVYEGLLASSPPNNMDSLTYHLTRAAAWAQHRGMYWIPNNPEVEVDAYQPLAEQQQLFLMVTTGGGSFYALPQYLAELAILVSVYGSSRRLGFAVRPAVAASGLLAMFSVVALEAVTAQNDLFAASFAAVAACLLLGVVGLETALAGVAAALGVGTKLTVVLVVPILAWLAIARGRRVLITALAGGIAGLLAVGMWGYVLNTVHTGHILGTGTGTVQDRGSPSYPRSVANAFDLAYGLMDTSVLSYRVMYLLAAVGIVAALAAAAWWLRKGEPRRAPGEAARSALPFLAPVLVIAGAALVAYGADVWGFPIRGPNGFINGLNSELNETYGRIANEDYSAYGPVGIVGLLAAIVLTVRAFLARRADTRQLALASALPVFLVLVALSSVWVPFLIRYFLLPAVLTAPLLAYLASSRTVAAAWLAVAAISIGFTITNDQPKPLVNPYGLGRPWNLTLANGLRTNSDSRWADALDAYAKHVPRGACVGVMPYTNEPVYLLYGTDLDHPIFYLPFPDPLGAARARVLSYVVVSSELPLARQINAQFVQGGWQKRKLNDTWTLYSVPRAGSGQCFE